jgi:hypothetical protein
MEKIIDTIRRDNPSAKDTTISYYYTLLCNYIEAEKNIIENGVIVAHPRTGAPIENPYHKIFINVGKLISTTKLKLDNALNELRQQS